MQSISVLELKQKLSTGENILLIDVRERYEHSDFNIGGKLIPLNVLFENIHEIEKERPVIIYCQKGIRSMLAIQRLHQKYGYVNLINLTGGMDAWHKSSDKG